MRRICIFVTAFFIIALSVIIYFRDPLSAKIFSVYLGNRLNADITARKVHLGLGPRLEIEDLRIVNSKGLDCRIKASTLNFDLQPMFWKNLKLRFDLKDARFSYPVSKIVKSITGALSIKTPQHLHFDYVKGEFYCIGDENIIKSLDANGKLLRLFANGSVRGLSINYSFKFLLSDELTADIPESTRKIFFKQGSQYSEIELYVTGSIDNPSINFSTDLFKLTVR